MYKILDGIRVLDLSRYIAGPSCCRILGDLGADVIKVEKAGRGDEARHCAPFKNGDSLYFAAYNRNKRSVTVDFRSDKGKTVLRGLIEKCDVIVENFKAGTMEAMGFSFKEIQKINPRAILVSITGFGQTGPDAKRPAYDRIVSYRSHLYDVPAKDRFDPDKSRFADLGQGIAGVGPDLMSDTVAGINAALATMAAIYDREKTGKGQWVDFSMLTSSVGCWPIALAYYVATGSSDFYIVDAPNGEFKTKDGSWVVIIAGSQPMFMRVREIIDNPIIKDEKYIDVKNRIADMKLLQNIISDWVHERTFEEVDEIMVKNGVTCGKINGWDDVLHDRQLAHRGDLVPSVLEHCGPIPYAKFPAFFSNHKYETDLSVPDLGEHNNEVLADLLGMTPEEAEEYTK